MNASDINDIRTSAHFRGISFSKHKKADVKKALIDNLLKGKIEPVCHWGAELICAGHYLELWENILYYCAKHIHCGNPKLICYLEKRFDCFKSIINSRQYLSEIELRKVPLKMLAIDVLIDANQAALEDGKEPFEGVGVHIAARPFELGVIDAFVFGVSGELVVLRLVAHEAAGLMDVLADHRPDHAVIQRQRTDVAAALHEGENARVVLAAMAGNFAGLTGAGEFGFIRFHGLASPAHGLSRAGVHGEPDTVPKVPSGLHAAAEHALKLAQQCAPDLSLLEGNA